MYFRDKKSIALLLFALVGLILGIVVQLAGAPEASRVIWLVGVAPVLAALCVEIAGSLRQGEVGLDILAALSMTAALAFGEALAAAIVAVMYAGGTFLEAFAEGRATHEMRSLLARVPRTATRHENGRLIDVPLETIAPGDRLLIRRGDVVPVDSTIASPAAYLDMSALTGESLPVRLEAGDESLSGSTNAGDAFDVVAVRRAEESTYAGIVRLVREAQAVKAPMARLADQWSLAFLAASVALALLAWWLSGDAVRAVAVLVVATPCPLILAVPVALVGGLSRAAHFGVLIKGAKPLEAMARIRTLILDKTGTLTDGRPKIVAIHSLDGMADTEILRLAAALDQASKHPVAQAITEAAKAQRLHLPIPSHVAETAGEGVVGIVEGRRMVVGGVAFVAQQMADVANAAPRQAAGAVVVAVGIDGRLAGHLVMSDPLREGAKAVLSALRHRGIQRLLLATGDRRDVAQRITEGLGFDALRAELTPDQKVLLVLSERKNGPVMMVGDGVNDAPALAAADVGVAMGARGAAASAEAADVVLLVDQIERLEHGIQIARASRRIALESVVAGIGLSMLGMILAVLGLLTPIQGALAQEAIDVAVILNALRTLQITPKD